MHRAVGTRLSSEVVTRHGPDGLAEGTLDIRLKGNAGQSLGAFLARGIRLTIEGDANDYAGKGLSGGRLIVYPPKNSDFAAEDNVIIGNVGLYGATQNKKFFRHCLLIYLQVHLDHLSLGYSTQFLYCLKSLLQLI